MLTLQGGRALSDSQVQAIVNLVASSVPGMSPDGVSVADQNGRLLSSRSTGGLSEETDRQVQVQARIEERYRQSIEALLAPILGAGNFTAQVHADVDFSETQATREGFPKDASTLRTEEGAVSVDGSGANGAAAAWRNSGRAVEPAAARPRRSPPLRTAPSRRPYRARRPKPARPSATRITSATMRSAGKSRSRGSSPVRSSASRWLSRSTTGRRQAAQPAGNCRAREAGQRRGRLRRHPRRHGGAHRPQLRTRAQTEPAWWEAGWVALVARNLTALVVAGLVIFGSPSR
jgi:flagellar M-ring protein FliF